MKASKDACIKYIEERHLCLNDIFGDLRKIKTHLSTNPNVVLTQKI